jgi:parallel beta-helix repeat protein
MPVWGDTESLDTGRINITNNFNNYKGRFDLPNSQTSPGSPSAGGKDWYWFDYGNARFIALPEPWAGALGDWNTKADALMAQAQTNPNVQYIVTFVHRPVYSSGHYSGSATTKGILDALGDKHNKYVLNLNSRSTNYERSHPQHGVVHVTAGIGGTNLAQDGTCLWLACTKPAWSAFRAMHQGALKLNFTTSSIEGSFICGPSGGGSNDVTCAKGSVVDSFKIVSPVSAVSTSDSGMVTPSSTGTASCTQTPLDISNASLESGYGYYIENIFGTPPDTNDVLKSTLRLFEGGKEIGPAHSSHADIRTKGLGRFSHKYTGAETLRFSASDNTDPRINGKSYTYCLTSDGVIPDAQAPSVPLNLKATASSPTEIDLSWSASTDNLGVTGYKIYRNNTQIGNIASTTYTDSVLSPGTSYTYTIVATDAVGNASVASTADTATTLAAATTSTMDAAATSSCAPAPTSSLVVNVKNKGAKGNGSANDTAAIQAAINQVGGTGGTVLIPDGTYMIQAAPQGLFPRSNMTIKMTSGAILKAIPTSLDKYSILRIENVSNVNVIGGKLQGERKQHQGVSGESGIGASVYASTNVTIQGVTATDMWGDGFYVGRAAKHITICSVVADNNRRQGISIVSGDGVIVKDSIFKNTNGTLPQSGVQIEPDANLVVRNVQILNSQALNNKGWGIKLTSPAANSSINAVTLDGNTVTGNGIGTGADGIVISRSSGHRVSNNIVKLNHQAGIALVNGSLNNIVTGNTVTNNGVNGVFQSSLGILMSSKATNNKVTNNTVTGHAKANIRDFVGGNTVTPNTVN